MATENNLEFLKDRIFEIKSALLFSLSDEIVKIPASIISILKIDEEGQLWFFTNRPKQILFDEDKLFPARLQFYRKGKPFYLQVAGIASIDDAKEKIHAFAGLNPETENKAMEDMLLIKLKMTKAEYYEQKPQADYHHPVRHLFQNLYSALFKPASYYRPFELNTNAA
jgi:general stress protein 26